MSLPASQYNLSRPPSASSSSTQTLDAQSLAYQEELAKACGVAINQRILTFSSEPPPSDHVANPSQAWSRPLRPSVKASSRRHVATLPERVLDAPGMVDDYYLNLLDWSSTNTLAVVLGKTIYLWSGETGEVTEFITAPATDSITSVAFTNDGSYLAVGMHEGDTQIWDLETGGKVRSMGGHVARVGVLSWRDHLLSSGCRDGSIFNHDVRVANHKVAELLAHTSEVCGLKWRPDGAFLASGGNDNLVNIWDARGNVPKWTKREHNAAVKALAWCPWQPHLLATGGGTHDRHIHFWNVSTGAKLSSLDTGSQVTSLHWSREYKEILSSHGFPDNQMTLWTYPALQKVADLQGHDARVLHTAAGPDGTMVASAAGDEALKLWRVWEKRPGKEAAELPGGGAAANDATGLAGAFERKATIR
ncbi:WD40-repeat-containing domain protein [Hyaloraphidium curvatum]|nr:WD40-repeat-containing domain protein [Hyaloraphidium curvatum]